MSFQPVLINGCWREADSPTGSFYAADPATGRSIQPEFPISSFNDLTAALNAGSRAAAQLRSCSPSEIAVFLEIFAGEIEEQAGLLVKTAARETGLPVEPRLLNIELPRTTNQLRQAAAAAREMSWCQATIDTVHSIRSKYSSLGGPIVVLGPNNFPLAFNSVSGGDFAAAVAAGNPVIAKANPGHPNTTRILAEAALKALQKTNLPNATIQLIYHMQPEDGLRLTSHPQTAATAFTGSRKAGLLLKQAAEQAGKLIYLEMSGVNPVFILPEAIAERAEEIADELSQSCCLGTGQFCTNPGLVIIQKNADGESFLNILTQKFKAHPAGTLLTQRIEEELIAAVQELQKFGATILTGGEKTKKTGFSFSPTLLCVSGKTFINNREALQKEAFGPVCLVVQAEDAEQIKAAAGCLEGNLTAAVYSHSRHKDDSLYLQIEPIIRTKVGRLINDKMPTGVAVSPAMNHGGPFPAGGHPGFTSIGLPNALKRFAALHCYDHVRAYRLPPELQDKNPTGRMWRYIDNTWTQSDNS